MVVVVQEEVHRNSTITTASRTLVRQHRPLATQAATLPIPAQGTRTRRTAHQPGHRREAICRAGHRQACIIRAQGIAALLDRPGRSERRISTLASRLSTSEAGATPVPGRSMATSDTQVSIHSISSSRGSSSTAVATAPMANREADRTSNHNSSQTGTTRRLLTPSSKFSLQTSPDSPPLHITMREQLICSREA